MNKSSGAFICYKFKMLIHTLMNQHGKSWQYNLTRAMHHTTSTGTSIEMISC